ncbi:MAG: sugar ABC transporter permease [Firmicutes bacterium]|nr:sugar ABC transporter permease [Bacillota bacterium]
MSEKVKNVKEKPASKKSSVSAVDMAPKKRKRGKSLERTKARAGYFFVLPFIIGLVVVYLPMIIQSINYSFMELNSVKGGGYELVFVGLENYSNALLVDSSYVQELIEGIQSLLFNIPAIVIFSLFMAILLNQDMAGRGLFRAIFFIPVIISTGLLADIDAQNILSNLGSTSSQIDTGNGENTVSQIVNVVDVERLFENMQIGSGLVEYVTNLVNDIFDIVNKSGVQMLIYLAGLQSISPAIYESCSIDGATAWETFWKITFPMISPMVLVNAIYTVIDEMTRTDNNVMEYISSVYEEAGGTVLAAAMSWMYFLIVMLLLAVITAILSAYTFYQRRDT